MSVQFASTFFDEPTPLIPAVMPRKMTRAPSSMTCPECDLKQSVSLDCAGCGRIMKPSTDFRLADPMLAPPSSGLETLEPVEAVGVIPGLADAPVATSPSPSFRVYDQAQSEGTPWLKMIASLLLCALAWALNGRLLGLETATRAAVEQPFWVELAHNTFGREGSVVGLVSIAAVLMIMSARQVLSGR